VARSALFESADRWAGIPRRSLAIGVVSPPSGSRPSFDGRDLTTCSSLENGHLHYLRDLWAICDGSVRSLCLCGSADGAGFAFLASLRFKNWRVRISN